jgi:hypothetical protein
MIMRRDLRNQKFGRLVPLVATDERDVRRNIKWLCRCECGKNCLVASVKLLYGLTKSCGCQKKERNTSGEVGRANRTHGHAVARTSEYGSWSAMKKRCLNSNCDNYSEYGGRGIKLCERWNVFENFLADMGLKPSPIHSIDRIDTNGNYEPSNCRWATPKEQQNNRRPARRKQINREGVSTC